VVRKNLGSVVFYENMKGMGVGFALSGRIIRMNLLARISIENPHLFYGQKNIHQII